MTISYLTPLPAETQKELGIANAAPFALADQVRFSELDVFRHVNNAVYMQWFEQTRVKYVQLYGLQTDPGMDAGPRIVIRSASIRYKQEMLAGEDYVVTCRCTAFRTTSFSMAQELWSGGTSRANFDCVLVLLQPDGSGRFPIPDALRQHFIRVDGAQPEG